MKRTLLGLLPLFTAVSLYAADEERCIEVTLNAPGQLGQVLGERIHEVDSLVVRAPWTAGISSSSRPPMTRGMPRPGYVSSTSRALRSWTMCFR